MTRKISSWVLGAVLAVAVCAQGADRTYATGTKEVEEIAVELYKSLDRKYLGLFRAQPLRVVTNPMPVLDLAEENAASGSHKVGVLVMSTGFIELINRVAHAKAIDRSKKGYLESYLRAWPEPSQARATPALPDIQNPDYWSEETIDQQTTYFGQMLGVAMGIKFANYYLGQYKKYAERLSNPADQPVSINKVISANEWEQAMNAGAMNSLDCAYGVDGFVALYECVDGLPKRPDWTYYFVPGSELVKFKKLKKDLEKIERRFFSQ